MQNILIIGAGKSSPYLIHYLSNLVNKSIEKIIVIDSQINKNFYSLFPYANFIENNILDQSIRNDYITSVDIVISLLPPNLHYTIALDCIKFKKHFFTASYLNDEIKALHELALENNLLLMMESGLDPGIDHLSAIVLIDKIKSKGGIITSFKSFCGGLPSRNSDNDWHYKVTWNPRNVILAGQMGGNYLYKNTIKHTPYHRLFKDTIKINSIKNGNLEAYINRDSLAYIEKYNLSTAHTFLRGTLRWEGFCENWAELIKLGITSDTYIIDFNSITPIEWFSSFLPLESTIEDWILQFKSTKQSFWKSFIDDLTSTTLTGNISSAQALQKILEKSWFFEETDNDFVLMIHQIEYMLENKSYTIQSEMSKEGKNKTFTAMAETVGLPLGIMVDLFINGEINQRGVCIPTDLHLAKLVINKLETNEIIFSENINSL